MKNIKHKANFLLFLLIGACTQNSDNTDKLLLLESNEIQKVAHMENNAALLCTQIADTMIQVSRGEVKKSSNKEVKDKFTAYFKTIKYRRWDDLQPPIIEIAESGDLATVIVDKIIETKPIDAHDSVYQKTIFAWTAIYKKYQGQWKIYSNTSTRKASN